MTIERQYKLLGIIPLSPKLGVESNAYFLNRYRAPGSYGLNVESYHNVNVTSPHTLHVHREQKLGIGNYDLDGSCDVDLKERRNYKQPVRGAGIRGKLLMRVFTWKP